MKQKLLLISGKKQSGKSSLRNFITGIKLVDNQVIKRFNISTKGELMVPVVTEDHLEILRCLDLNQRNFEFQVYASQKIWPIVKNYSIANYLKYNCIDLFGLDYEQCFGTDDDKNRETNIRWSDISFALPPRKFGTIKAEGKSNYFLTAREFMEEFGTICRKINEDCWINKCKSEIKIEQYPFCIIDDIRYPNEIKVLLDDDFDIFTIRLNRAPFKSTSEGETALDGYTKFDLVIDDVPIQEKNEIALNALKEKGWL